MMTHSSCNKGKGRERREEGRRRREGEWRERAKKSEGEEGGGEMKRWES